MVEPPRGLRRLLELHSALKTGSVFIIGRAPALAGKYSLGARTHYLAAHVCASHVHNSQGLIQSDEWLRCDRW
jgi:hypothetical protein